MLLKNILFVQLASLWTVGVRVTPAWCALADSHALCLPQQSCEMGDRKTLGVRPYAGTQGTEKTEVLRTRFFASYTALPSLSVAERGRYSTLIYRFPLLRPLLKNTPFSSSVYRHLFISCLSAFEEYPFTMDWVKSEGWAELISIFSKIRLQ